jgi:zinc transport system ATP-binding protein
MGTIVRYVKTIACVNGKLHYHSSNQITQKDLDEYNCPIQIIKYGAVPHIILNHHHK